MNVYDAAHQLARALKGSPEYQEVKRLQKKVNEDESTKRMYEDFRSQELSYQMKRMSGEEPSAEEIERLQQTFEVIRLNPDVAQLLAAEQRFTIMLDDMNRIIGEALQQLDPHFQPDGSNDQSINQ